MDNNEFGPAGGPQPMDGTVVGGTGKKKRNLTWLWISLGVLLLCAIVVVVLVLTGVIGGGPARQGNAGVWALYDFFDQEMQGDQQQMSKTQAQIGERVLSEPFEIEAEIEIDSDLFMELGVPMSSIGVDVDVKYDLEDLGVKLSALGMFEAGLYLLEDEFVLDVLGEAASTQIPLDFEADMGDPMTLKERAMAFLPFLPEDNSVWMDLLTQVAVSVPDELTDVDTEDVYSPLDGEEVEMKAIRTEIDEGDMEDILDNFSDGMRENKELEDQLQDILDDFTDFFGLDDVDLDDGLDELEEAANDLGGEKFEVWWTVYERGGKYVGFSAGIENEDGEQEIFAITEYAGDKGYALTISTQDGVEIQRTETETEMRGNEMEFESDIEISIPDPYTGETYSITGTIGGESSVSKEGGNEYNSEMAFAIDLDLSGYAQLMNQGGFGQEFPERIALDLKIEAECRFGDDLGSLEDDRDWGDIYDKDWGDFEDMFNNLSGLGSML